MLGEIRADLVDAVARGRGAAAETGHHLWLSERRLEELDHIRWHASSSA